MKKRNLQWTISDLIKNIENIEFPEYQREATVWHLEKKRKLIDSILRDLDIASIYLYKKNNKLYDCIDGRQRINAILSYLNINYEGEDNGFVFKSSDELLDEKILEEYNNKTWEDIKLIVKLKDKFLNYEFNVIEISQLLEEELNLLFLRLQLGSPLNAGEKLKAMRGEMRDYIFEDLGKKEFFNNLQIPPRRFSKELTAAQIAINYFSLKIKKEFIRARFVDLQEFFKEYVHLSQEARKLSKELLNKINDINKYLNDNENIKLGNRAISITLFFFIDKLIENKQTDKIEQFLHFFQKFQNKLKEQVALGIDIDRKFKDLLKFQTYISQAAVEKYAIENRHKLLEEYFDYYLKNNQKLKGEK